MDLSNNEITRNLVISGGSMVGLVFYGALKEMNKREYWKYEELNKIYCTSAGSMVTLLLLLNYDYEQNPVVHYLYNNILRCQTLKSQLYMSQNQD